MRFWSESFDTGLQPIRGPFATPSFCVNEIKSFWHDEYRPAHRECGRLHDDICPDS